MSRKNTPEKINKFHGPWIKSSSQGMASNGYLGCSGVIATNYDFGTSYLFNYSMNVMLLLINNGISEFREFIGLNYPGILKMIS